MRAGSLSPQASVEVTQGQGLGDHPHRLPWPRSSPLTQEGSKTCLPEGTARPSLGPHEGRGAGGCFRALERAAWPGWQRSLRAHHPDNRSAFPSHLSPLSRERTAGSGGGLPSWEPRAVRVCTPLIRSNSPAFSPHSAGPRATGSWSTGSHELGHSPRGS